MSTASCSQVGVHIADVTYFVPAGCALDEEAASRSTSTYLVDKRLDMLPGLLTESLCSLKPNVDRCAGHTPCSLFSGQRIVHDASPLPAQTLAA